MLGVCCSGQKLVNLVMKKLIVGVALALFVIFSAGVISFCTNKETADLSADPSTGTEAVEEKVVVSNTATVVTNPTTSSVDPRTIADLRSLGFDGTFHKVTVSTK